MPFPSPTTGLGVAAKIAVQGNNNPGVIVPGKNGVTLSLSGANGPTTFQLSPVLQDAAGNVINPGTAFTLTAVAASSGTALTLSAVDALGNYTGTITGGANNALVGQDFVVAGFTNAANNGTFTCTASTATVLTLANVAAVAETHAGTATNTQGTAVYTGTITGGGSNAFAGLTFTVAGFTNAANNGTFIATASSGTTLTLENDLAGAETHAATATSQEIVGGSVLTYSVDGAASLTGGTSPVSGTVAKVVSVSASGLLSTNGVEGHSVVEVAYPTYNNTAGVIVAAGQNFPLNKVYAEVNVRVRK